MQYLVLGASGYVGNYLYNRIMMDGLEVIGTGNEHKGGHTLKSFNMLRDSVINITNLLTDEERTAIICIARANIDQCAVEYELSRQINVTYMKKLIGELVRQKFHVIYFSTDNVFDGVKGNYTEQDQTNAINQYGKMKEEMEHFLAEQYPEVCIFRMPRVVGAEKEKNNMLTDLESKLEGKKVKCIKNNRMSIIAKEDIYRACKIASERKLQGIYNLSSGEVYSRKELAEIFFNAMRAENMEIVEIELEEFGFKDNRPLDIGLNNNKFKEELDYEFITYEKLIGQYLMGKI